MASCITSPANGTISSGPWPSAESLLEASIPGFSIISGLAKTYFRLDVSALITTLLPIAAIVAAVQYIYDPMVNYLWRYGVCTAEIRNDDEIFNYVMYWISQQKFSQTTRDYLAGTKTSSSKVYDRFDDNDDVRNDDESDWQLAEENFDQYWAQTTVRDKFKQIYFTPCDGSHYFKFKRQWLCFERTTQETRIGHYSDKQETLRISCFGRDDTVLKELLKEAQKAYVARDGNNTIIYRKSGGCDDWQRCTSRPPRPISTVVLGAEQKDAIVDDIKEYLHPLTKRWYANRGIPYRRGYLLYGPPGTGKTSLCFALAGLFGLEVYVVSLNSRSLTEDGLATLFDYLPDRCVVLLEDIDSAGITHKRAAEEPAAPKENQGTEMPVDEPTGNGTPTGRTNGPVANITLSGLLNIIDGVASSEGRILLMTTNHVEKLDPALLRPGRVDMSIAFHNADTATATEMFQSTYTSRDEDFPVCAKKGMKENRHILQRKLELSDVEIEHLATQFAAQIPAGEFSPAEIQGYLMKHKSRPREAVNGVSDWMTKTREEKANRRKPDVVGSEQREDASRLDNMRE